MPTFSYKALDSEGAFFVGEIEAPDKRDVARRLERLGYVTLDTGAAAPAGSPQRFFSFERTVGLSARAFAGAACGFDARRRLAAAGG